VGVRHLLTAGYELKPEASQRHRADQTSLCLCLVYDALTQGPSRFSIPSGDIHQLHFHGASEYPALCADLVANPSVLFLTVHENRHLITRRSSPLVSSWDRPQKCRRRATPSVSGWFQAQRVITLTLARRAFLLPEKCTL